VGVLQAQGLRGHDPFVVAGDGGAVGLSVRAGRPTATEDQRADAVGVAEGQQAVVGDQGDDGVGALDPVLGGGDGVEDGVGVQVVRPGGGLQLIGKYVEQQFGIRGGVEVAPVAVAHLGGQLAGVGEVAVVHQGDAVGGVD